MPFTFEVTVVDRIEDTYSVHSSSSDKSDGGFAIFWIVSQDLSGTSVRS